MGGMPATAAGVGAAAAGGAVGSHADRQGQRSRVGGNSSSSTQGPARGLGGVSSGAEDGDDDTEPVERSVEQLAEMEPSKLKQHTARLIQRTLGGRCPQQLACAMAAAMRQRLSGGAGRWWMAAAPVAAAALRAAPP